METEMERPGGFDGVHAHWPKVAEDAVPPMTVGDALRRTAARAPDAVALVDARPGGGGRRWTYAQLLDEGERAARAMLPVVGSGGRVAVFAGNRPEWVVVEMGAALAGLVLVPTNPALRPRELAHVLRGAKPALVLHDHEYRGVDLTAMLAELDPASMGIRTVPLDDFDALVAEADPALELPEVPPESPMQILHTSGTTGLPKGAVLRHRGMTLMCGTCLGLLELEHPPVWLNVMPMFHVGGTGLSTLAPLLGAGTQVLSDRFDPAQVLDLIESERVTVFGSVPTMLQALLQHPGFDTADLSSLEVVMSGGTTVAPALIREVEKRFGVNIVVAFGQTETHGNLSQTRPNDSAEDKAETLGRPFPNVEVKIVDTTTLETVKLGEVGELWARSSMLMSGYLDLPEATAATMTEDGFVRTGDLCTMDSRGYLRFAGRSKELICSGGENVYPREVEEVLSDYEGVGSVAVVGLPHPVWGEQVGAAVVPAPGATVDTAALAAWARTQLTPYKVPKRWLIVDDLPLTPAGKVQRFVLAEQFPPE